MKTNLTRTMILAATVVLSAAAVFAQTKLTAKIPFAFGAMTEHMSAGRYEVVSASSATPGVLRIRNVATGEAANLGIGVPTVPENPKGARLVFKCAGETCAVSEVWRDDGRGYKFATPRVKPSQLERVAVIYLDRKNAD
jgi:hypothetical protein